MTLPTKISNPVGKSRSFLVPTILIATVLITGFFAFSPIDKASTIHTTIIGAGGLDFDDLSNTQLSIQVVTDSGTGITDGDTVIIDCDNDFVLLDSYWGIDDFDGASFEELSIGDSAGNFITVDGVLLIGESEAGDDSLIILGNVVGNLADNVNIQRSWKATVMDEILIGGFIKIPLILFAVGAGANDIVFTLEDTGADPIDASDTLTVTALIQTESNANCSVDVNT